MNIVLKQHSNSGVTVWWAQQITAQGVSFIEEPSDIQEPYRVMTRVCDVTEVFCYDRIEDAVRKYRELMARKDDFDCEPKLKTKADERLVVGNIRKTPKGEIVNVTDAMNYRKVLATDLLIPKK